MRINIKPLFHVLFNGFESSKVQDLVCITIMPHINNLFKDVRMQSIIFN